MTEPLLFSIIESPLHPNLSELYRRSGLQEVKFTAMRKAISALKKQQPDWVVADFVYGYGNNYAGVNISNLDVFLLSLAKYRRDTRVIVLADKSEQQHVQKLNQTYPVHEVLTYPVAAASIQSLLDAADDQA